MKPKVEENLGSLYQKPCHYSLNYQIKNVLFRNQLVKRMVLSLMLDKPESQSLDFRKCSYSTDELSIRKQSRNKTGIYEQINSK